MVTTAVATQELDKFVGGSLLIGQGGYKVDIYDGISPLHLNAKLEIGL